MSTTNPFAAPADRPIRVPPTTTGDFWGMRSVFQVGRHRVEIETGHWNGTEIYRIDGEEQVRKRNLGWHSGETLQVGRHTVHVQGRWYPLLPVTVEVDGHAFIDDLFPQLRRLTRVIGLAAASAMGVLTASIVWDVYRWMQL